MRTLNRIQGLTLAYAATLAGVILAANAGVLPVQYLLPLPGGDKTGHFLVMGLLALLVNLSLGGLRWRHFTALRGCLGLWLLVALEELSQHWLRNRSFELPDLAADTAGIFTLGLLAGLRRPDAYTPGRRSGKLHPL